MITSAVAPIFYSSRKQCCQRSGDLGKTHVSVNSWWRSSRRGEHTAPSSGRWRGGHRQHRRRSSILSGRTRYNSSKLRYILPRPFALFVTVHHSNFYRRRNSIMLNALSRAAIGALKASKSNLTPKIVQNELPKAMVATTSTCEYYVPFSLILPGRS